MKIASYLSLILLVTSCFLKKKQEENTQVITNAPEKTIQDSTIQRLLISSNLIDTNVLQLHYQYYVSPKTACEDSVNAAISTFVYGTVEPEQYGTKPKVNDLFFTACLDSFYQDAVEFNKESELMGLFEFELGSEIEDKTKLFTTLSQFSNLYTGGAHPYGYNLYQIFSKTDGHLLKLKDFISDTIAFNRLAEKHFRQQNELSNDNFSDLGFWFENNEFQCNDNFYFADDGIHFLFNIYEIAPYAMGYFEFHVPYSEFGELLKISLSKN